MSRLSTKQRRAAQRRKRRPSLRYYGTGTIIINGMVLGMVSDICMQRTYANWDLRTATP